MTKTQAKAKLKSLLERLDNIKTEFENLQSEAQDTADDIAPYEGKDDLTEAQEQRQEWFEELASTLEDQISNIEDIDSELVDYTY